MTRYLVTETDGHCYGFATAEAAITRAGACARILATDNGGTSTRPLSDEESVVRNTRHVPESRYDYDFTLCRNPKTCDWAQIDTGSDAHYRGQWANPFTRTIVSYAEGDETTIKCCDDERFLAELQHPHLARGTRPVEGPRPLEPTGHRTPRRRWRRQPAQTPLAALTASGIIDSDEAPRYRGLGLKQRRDPLPARAPPAIHRPSNGRLAERKHSRLRQVLQPHPPQSTTHPGKPPRPRSGGRNRTALAWGDPENHPGRDHERKDTHRLTSLCHRIVRRHFERSAFVVPTVRMAPRVVHRRGTCPRQNARSLVDALVETPRHASNVVSTAGAWAAHRLKRAAASVARPPDLDRVSERDLQRLARRESTGTAASVRPSIRGRPLPQIGARSNLGARFGLPQRFLND